MKWNAGVYIKKTGKRNKTNFAIINRFLSNNLEINIYSTYVDGEGHFNNFEFRRMMESIINKKINTIIVRNLKDLGKNYIEVYHYLKIIFPAMKVRFISIEEGVDSYSIPKSIESITAPFRQRFWEVFSMDEKVEKEMIKKLRKLRIDLRK